METYAEAVESWNRQGASDEVKLALTGEPYAVFIGFLNGLEKDKLKLQASFRSMFFQLQRETPEATPQEVDHMALLSTYGQMRKLAAMYRQPDWCISADEMGRRMTIALGFYYKGIDSAPESQDPMFKLIYGSEETTMRFVCDNASHDPVEIFGPVSRTRKDIKCPLCDKPLIREN